MCLKDKNMGWPYSSNVDGDNAQCCQCQMTMHCHHHVAWALSLMVVVVRKTVVDC